MGGRVSGVGAGMGNNRSLTARLFFCLMVVVIIVQSGIFCNVICVNAVINMRPSPPLLRNHSNHHNVGILTPPAARPR
jgi:hypothetical protein